MQTDALDNLPDAQLSWLFAVEVAGYTLDGDGWFVPPPPARQIALLPSELPSYTTSADAVMPFIHQPSGWAEFLQWDQADGRQAPPRWRARVMGRHGFIEGEAPTFARAACLALIRATRAKRQ